MPDAIAIVGRELQWTWLEFHQAVLRTVQAIRGYGIGAGERVAFLGLNSDVYLIVLQACYRMGAILAPFNWRLAPAEIDQLIEDSGARLLIVDDAMVPVIQ